MTRSVIIKRLMSALRCLPGVGPKSAQRMTYHILERDRDGGRHLAEALLEAVERIGNCRQCRTLSETDLCGLCADPGRDAGLVCVVESPADIEAIDTGTDFRGRFFVLMGHLSPLDGIGPGALGIPVLEQRLAKGSVRELILATGSTVEGQATTHYIGTLAREHGVRATRIALGVPLGGELEFVDSGTLAHAFAGRSDYR